MKLINETTAETTYTNENGQEELLSALALLTSI